MGGHHELPPRGEVPARAWTLRVRDLQLTIHRHRDYEPGQWLLTCPQVRQGRYALEAYGTDDAALEAAKAEAIEHVRTVLRVRLVALEGL